jgi:L-ascorbate metabolism protein UlaG (beta-lactamase superfamily)
MPGKKKYLHDAVVAEPHVGRWYAWPYLLSPAPAAMFVANAHVKLLESFVAYPAAHASALLDPALRGGPFVGCDPTQVDDVKALLDATKSEAADALRFARAVAELDALLAAEAHGYSLEPLYPRVPAALRGYVELTYDLANRASFRFFEPLLYRSRYWVESRQGVCLSRTSNRRRGFVFTTPRLASEVDLSIDLPLRSPALDALYRARREPTDVGALADALGLDARGAGRLDAFLAEGAPRRGERYRGAGARVRYFGHASVLIETAEVSVLSDPVPSHGDDTGAARFTDADLPENIDFVLITHNHQDHCMLEPLLELRHRIGCVVVPKAVGGTLLDPSLQRTLRAAGFRHVVELGELESMPLPGEGAEVVALPFLGEHGDLDVRTKAGYLVRAGGRALMLLADSNNLEPELYAHLAADVGPVDVIFLGMECVGAPMSWLYGPLFVNPPARKMDQSRRLDGSNARKAFDIIERFSPGRVYVYAMGQEEWLAHITTLRYTEQSPAILESNGLLELCRARRIEAERLYQKYEFVLA